MTRKIISHNTATRIVSIPIDSVDKYVKTAKTEIAFVNVVDVAIVECVAVGRYDMQYPTSSHIINWTQQQLTDRIQFHFTAFRFVFLFEIYFSIKMSDDRLYCIALQNAMHRVETCRQRQIERQRERHALLLRLLHKSNCQYGDKGKERKRCRTKHFMDTFCVRIEINK